MSADDTQIFLRPDSPDAQFGEEGASPNKSVDDSGRLLRNPQHEIYGDDFNVTPDSGQTVNLGGIILEGEGADVDVDSAHLLFGKGTTVTESQAE